MCRKTINGGPDDEGIYIVPRIGLREQRLSITALSPSAMLRLVNEDNTVRVVLNGEIHNFKKLRSEVINK